MAVRFPRHFWKCVFLALLLVLGYLLEDLNTWRPNDGTEIPGHVRVLYFDRITNTIGELHPDDVEEQISRLEEGGKEPSFLIEQEAGRYSPFVDLDHGYEINVVSGEEQIVTHYYELALLNHAEVRYRATDKAIELIYAKSGLAGGLGYLLAFLFAGLIVVVLRIAIMLVTWAINLIRKISDY